jgi:hypothetical protein
MLVIKPLTALLCHDAHVLIHHTFYLHVSCGRICRAVGGYGNGSRSGGETKAPNKVSKSGRYSSELDWQASLKLQRAQLFCDSVNNAIHVQLFNHAIPEQRACVTMLQQPEVHSKSAEANCKNVMFSLENG